MKCFTVLLIFALLLPLAQAARVAVVADNGATVQTACVTYSGTKTAEDILSSSGLGMELRDDGFLCKIGATGCPASDCLCSAPYYWAFFYSYGGSWTYSNYGVSDYEVHNGEILGFRWTDWNIWPTEEPAQRSFSEICSSSGDEAWVIPAVRHFSVSLPNRTLCAGEPINVSVFSLEDEGPIWEISTEPSPVPGRFEREAFFGASARAFRKDIWWNLVSAQEVGKTGTLELSAEKPGAYSLDISKTGFVQVLKSFDVADCTPVPECAVNAGCADDQACEQGSCVQLSGSCGYIENHAFTEYECCSDSACGAPGSGARCEAHSCIVRSQPELGEIMRVLFGYHII